MAVISVEITGAQDLIDKLNRLGEELLHLPGEFEQLGEELTEYYAERPIASQGGVFGSRWPPLNPEYSIEKARDFPGRPMLVRTGAMASSFGFQSGVNFVRIDNAADYFRRHQLGEGVPQRLMLSVNKAVQKTVEDILGEGIERKIEES